MLGAFHLFLFVGLNVLFLGGVFLTYLLVVRRRTRVQAVVEHLASLAEAGLPLQTGLRMVGQDAGGILGTRLARVARRMEDGASLAEAYYQSVAGPFDDL